MREMLPVSRTLAGRNLFVRRNENESIFADFPNSTVFICIKKIQIGIEAERIVASVELVVLELLSIIPVKTFVSKNPYIILFILLDR